MDHSIIALAETILTFGAATAGAASGGRHATRTIKARIDVAGTSREAVIGIGEAPAGGSMGLHSHPGEEIAYVVSGTLVLKVQGADDRVLHAGDSYTLPNGTVHDILGQDGPSQVVVVWVVDKAQPFSSPAP